MPRNQFGFGVRPIKIKPMNFGIDLVPKPGGSKSGSTKCPPTLKLAIKKRWWKDKYVGECFCCGRKNLHYEDADAGHIKAASKGGRWSPANNRLICRSCNGSMRNTNMKVYMRRNFPERYKRYFPKTEKSTRKPRTRRGPKQPTTPWGIKPIKFPKIGI